MMKWLPVYLLFLAASLPLEGQFRSTLEETAKDFTGVAKKAIPAVVSIKVTSVTERGGFRSPHGLEFDSPFQFFNEDLLRQFFGGNLGERQVQMVPQVAQGSGVIVSDDGYILTNSHMVRDGGTISVILNDGREMEGKLVGQDPNTDLAVIKVEGENLPTLPLGDSDQLEVGQWVIAIGSPLELQATLTVGVVSAKGRNNLDIANIEDFIQTDAAINRGNSGGPLLTLSGEVVGINTAIATSSMGGGYMGIGFAIPSNIAKNIMEQLKETGGVKRGYLGVYPQEINGDLASAFELMTTEGVLVSQVEKDSPADQAGLKQGDVIRKIDGKEIKNVQQFRNTIALKAPGSKIQLLIFREGQEVLVPITLGAFPEGENPLGSVRNVLGVQVDTLTSDNASRYGYNSERGVVITQVEANSPAAAVGIQKGALILSINREKVLSAEDFYQALNDREPDRPLLLLIKQNNQIRFVSIRI
ncbi:MAG: Do family serine endopeptidase [Chlamydiia bacterium]|nr:Do family serine endopeptidase [Chlamydiia bacterium]